LERQPRDLTQPPTLFAGSITLNSYTAGVHVGKGKTAALHKHDAAVARGKRSAWTRLSREGRQEKKRQEAAVLHQRARDLYTTTTGAAAPTRQQILDLHFPSAAPATRPPPAIGRFQALISMVAVDPGQRDFVTAVTANHGPGSTTHPSKRPLVMSTAAYQSAAGFDNAAAALHRTERHPSQQNLMQHLKRTPSKYGCDPQQPRRHAVHVSSRLRDAKALYGRIKAQAREQREHRAKTPECHRMARRLFWGSTTVRGRFWGTQLRVGYKPWGARHGVDPRQLRPPPAIVGWGNGKGGGGGCISRHGGGAPIVEFSRHWVLREYCGRRHGCLFFLVREWLTSQVCSSCWRRTLGSFTDQWHKERYELKRCSHCDAVVHRDVNAARCHAVIMLCLMFGEALPEALQPPPRAH